MNKLIKNLAILVLLLGCNKKQNNHDLYGDWISFKSTNIVTIHFEHHKMTVNQWGRDIENSWTCDDSLIYISQLTHVNTELPTDYEMIYKLNATKDTLYLKQTNSNFSNEFVRISADDAESQK
uniref:hypothetical protein n=1 Tax=Flavobacterium sp. TaxID=239 RepID=UPI00404908E2